MNAIVKDTLPPAWKKFFTFRFGQIKLIRELVCNMRDACFTLCREAEYREH